MSRKFFIPHDWIQDDYWEGEPLELLALIYLIGNANYKDGKYARGNTVINVARGECVISHRSFAEKIGWKKDKVAPFLEKYQKLDYIQTEVRHFIPVVTICNYDELSRLPDTRPDRSQTDVRQMSDESQTNHSNTSKGSNNSNNKYSADFERLWKDYDNRPTDSKREASKKYTLAVKAGFSPSEIYDCCMNYQATVIDKTYVKALTTLLQGQKFADFTEVKKQKIPLNDVLQNTPQYRHLSLRRMHHNKENEHAFRQITGYGFSDIQ